MTKARALRRIIQDQGKLHCNRVFNNPLHAVIVRIPQTGSISKVDVPKIPAEVTLVNAKSFDFEPYVHPFSDSLPVFATTESFWAGQAWGILTGPDLVVLSRLANQFIFEVQEPAIVPPRRLHSQKSFTNGDCLEALSTCHKKFESRFNQDTQKSFDPENQPIFVAFDEALLTIECTSPWPHLLRKLVSEACGLPQKSIRIRCGMSQPGHHERLYDLIIPTILGALAALYTHRSIMVAWTAHDIAYWGVRRSGGSMSIITGHNEEGHLLAMRALVEIDLGAFPLASREVLTQTILSMIGRYEVEHLDVKVRIFASSDQPMSGGPCFGSSVTQTALELHWDRVAAGFDISPLEWRVQNLKHSITGPGQLLFDDSLQPMLSVLKRASKASDFLRRRASYRLHARHREKNLVEYANIVIPRDGIGISFGYQPNNLLDMEQGISPEISLRLEEDGQLTVRAPLESGDVSNRELWTHCIHAALGIQERDIHFCPFDTSEVEDCGPMIVGRVKAIVAPLLAQACKLMKQAMIQAERPVAVKAVMDKAIFKQWDPHNLKGNAFTRRAWACAVVDLQVTPGSAEIDVRHVWLHVHAGSGVNEAKTRSQLEYSIRENLDRCLSQAFSARAKAQSENHAARNRYAQTAIHVQMHVDSGIEESGTDTLENLCGVMDVPDMLVPAAFMNALSQALDHPMESFPPSPLNIMHMEARE